MATLTLQEREVVTRFQKLPLDRRNRVLQKLLQQRPTRTRRERVSKTELMEAYKVTAARDRRMAAEWAHLREAWPEK
jgi:hypothetical protein